MMALGFILGKAINIAQSLHLSLAIFQLGQCLTPRASPLHNAFLNSHSILIMHTYKPTSPFAPWDGVGYDYLIPTWSL